MELQSLEKLVEKLSDLTVDFIRFEQNRKHSKLRAVFQGMLISFKIKKIHHQITTKLGEHTKPQLHSNDGLKAIVAEMEKRGSSSIDKLKCIMPLLDDMMESVVTDNTPFKVVDTIRSLQPVDELLPS